MSGLAILCSGQGRQDFASFEALLKYPEARIIFERLRDSGLIPESLERYFDSPALNPGVIFDNESAQPFVVIYHIMLWEILKNIIPDPSLFAGYSLGELSIYGLAGVIEAEDLLRLSVLRGHAMSKSAASSQAMVAVVGLNHDQIEKVCRACDSYVAIINAEDHFVAGMPADKMNIFVDECRKSGASKTVHLPVSIASHTPYMVNAALEFSRELRKTCFHASVSGIISGVSGEKLFSREAMIDALTLQISHTIDWRACMESAVSYGCRVFIETGPGSSLSKMLLDLFPGIEARSVSDFHDIRMMKNWVEAAMKRQR
ncbi:MAG: hypothetical protein A2020_06695 [Lentisphaerae bacterium GWF2_45_14]|nr:MAG: hypothetical protein A2020_06695 [Lentisphaerae bacterium GWF2_45_14]